ncbi:cell division protein PerM, partial [Microbacterium resistens]|uniref:cell division protein PerM n=1 Tax=Microbacterium resistens TaxID=156977 RepID=UPI000ACB78CD
AALLRGGEVVALFEALRVDGLGVTAISLGQLAYLPTLVCWAVAWLAGPGFALGTGTAVSPAGTELGVVPGIPMLGLLPEATSPWMLVVVLIPIGAGALAGWIIRSRQASAGNEPDVLPQATTALAIAVLAAGGAALLAVLSSGSIGPGRLAEVGPDAGPVALAVGIEVLVGAGILLLGPRHRDELRAEELLGTDEVGREDPRG